MKLSLEERLVTSVGAEIIGTSGEDITAERLQWELKRIFSFELIVLKNKKQFNVSFNVEDKIKNVIFYF